MKTIERKNAPVLVDERGDFRGVGNRSLTGRQVLYSISYNEKREGKPSLFHLVRVFKTKVKNRFRANTARSLEKAPREAGL